MGNKVIYKTPYFGYEVHASKTTGLMWLIGLLSSLATLVFAVAYAYTRSGEIAGPYSVFGLVLCGFGLWAHKFRIRADIQFVEAYERAELEKLAK